MSTHDPLPSGVRALALVSGLTLACGMALADDDAPKREAAPAPKRMVLVELFTSQG